MSLRRACPDMPLPGCCLFGALINHLSPAFLAAANFCFDARRGRAAPAGKGAERYLQHHLFHQLIKPRERQEATWSSGSLLAGAATLLGGIVVPKRRVARDRCGPKEQAGGAMQRAEKLPEIGR